LFFCIEVYIALDVNDAFVRPYVGDMLVVMLLYCGLQTFVKISMLNAAVFVLIFATIIEILQYFNWVQLLHLESNDMARVVMGTSFEWLDILAYSVGTVVVIVVEKVFEKKLD
jgi:hypothetical protein